MVQVELTIERYILEKTTIVIEAHEESMRYIESLIDDVEDLKKKNIDMAMEYANRLQGHINYIDSRPISKSIETMYEIKKDD